jgi:hypothetical protein
MNEVKVKFDFGKIEYEEIDGKKQPAEEKVKGFRKFVAEHCYYNTIPNLGLRILSMELFKNPVVEVDRAQVEALKEETGKMQILNPIAPSFEKVLNDCLTALDKAAIAKDKEDKKKMEE